VKLLLDYDNPVLALDDAVAAHGNTLMADDYI
jgi:hypothetical protein